MRRVYLCGECTCAESVPTREEYLGYTTREEYLGYTTLGYTLGYMPPCITLGYMPPCITLGTAWLRVYSMAPCVQHGSVSERRSLGSRREEKPGH